MYFLAATKVTGLPRINIWQKVFSAQNLMSYSDFSIVHHHEKKTLLQHHLPSIFSTIPLHHSLPTTFHQISTSKNTPTKPHLVTFAAKLPLAPLRGRRPARSLHDRPETTCSATEDRRPGHKLEPAAATRTSKRWETKVCLKKKTCFFQAWSEIFQ